MMKYLAWEEVKNNDVIYDTVKKENIKVTSKFYNVYAQPMFTADSKTDTAIIRMFNENRYTIKWGDIHDDIEQ